MTVPVTVLSGTLGAGKTTLLNHVLSSDHGYEVAVLVNDMGEVNVDARSIQRRVEDDREVLELSNGCICCGIQGEFEQAITDLALNESFEYLLVEPSGISEPAPVAQQFVASHAATFYDLSSVTTVVDARQCFDAFEDGEPERRGTAEDESRPLSDLLVEGIEFCDTVVLNKTDLVDEDEREAVRGMIRTLQPEATIVETTFGQVDPDGILDTGRFDVERVSESASWKRALAHYREHGETARSDGDHSDDHSHDHDDHSHDSHDHDDSHDHLHPPEQYGVDSMVYHRRRPMDPDRLVDCLESLPEQVLRAKGYLHVAGRPEHALTMSLAGQQTHVEVAGRWVASLPEDRRQRYREHRDVDWEEPYGDRKTELVVIGQDLDRSGIEQRLDGCLTADAQEHSETAPPDNPFPDREGTELRL